MRNTLILTGALLICAVLLLAAPPASSGHALPEYAAQTGEPCSSCHISPSGGGARGPRGQAWVASAKPSVVPDLTASLELLGVELQNDPAYFAASEESVEPAAPLVHRPARGARIFELLSGFDGN